MNQPPKPPPSFGETLNFEHDIGSQVFAYGGPPAEPRPWDRVVPLPDFPMPSTMPMPPQWMVRCPACSGRAFVFGPTGREPCGACQKEWREEFLSAREITRAKVADYDKMAAVLAIARTDMLPEHPGIKCFDNAGFTATAEGVALLVRWWKLASEAEERFRAGSNAAGLLSAAAKDARREVCRLQRKCNQLLAKLRAARAKGGA